MIKKLSLLSALSLSLFSANLDSVKLSCDEASCHLDMSGNFEGNMLILVDSDHDITTGNPITKLKGSDLKIELSQLTLLGDGHERRYDNRMYRYVDQGGVVWENWVREAMTSEVLVSKNHISIENFPANKGSVVEVVMMPEDDWQTVSASKKVSVTDVTTETKNPSKEKIQEPAKIVKKENVKPKEVNNQKSSIPSKTLRIEKQGASHIHINVKEDGAYKYQIELLSIQNETREERDNNYFYTYAQSDNPYWENWVEVYRDDLKNTPLIDASTGTISVDIASIIGDDYHDSATYDIVRFDKDWNILDGNKPATPEVSAPKVVEKVVEKKETPKVKAPKTEVEANTNDTFLIFDKEVANHVHIDVSEDGKARYQLELLDIFKETGDRSGLNSLSFYEASEKADWDSWKPMDNTATKMDDVALVDINDTHIRVNMKNVLGDAYRANQSFHVLKFDKNWEELSNVVIKPKTLSASCKMDLDHLFAKGCTLINSDTAEKDNVEEIWGSVDCGHKAEKKDSSGRDRYIQDYSRAAWIGDGGDSRLTALGAAQGNLSYRNLIVKDGDDYYGERCEIGLNSAKETFAGYFEGDYRVTFFSIRLAEDFPLSTDLWQYVFQMKQAQVTNNSDGTPILSLAAKNNQWKLVTSPSTGFSEAAKTVWKTPAKVGVWTRFAFEILYSKDPKKGWVKVYVDLNGDGDTLDAGEQSEKMHMSTLKRQLEGPDKSIPVGDSVPSHFRVGPYHHGDIDCPEEGCAFGLDNVQVVAPW